MGMTRYVWNDVTGTCLMEKNEAFETTAVYTSEPNGRGLISQRQTASRYYHFDGQFSTRAITSSIQEITDTYTYSCFGLGLHQMGNTENRFRYLGSLGGSFDSATQDYFFAAYYSPASGRWLTGRMDGKVQPKVYSFSGKFPSNPSGVAGYVKLLPQHTFLCGAHALTFSWWPLTFVRTRLLSLSEICTRCEETPCTIDCFGDCCMQDARSDKGCIYEYNFLDRTSSDVFFTDTNAMGDFSSPCCGKNNSNGSIGYVSLTATDKVFDWEFLSYFLSDSIWDELDWWVLFTTKTWNVCWQTLPTSGSSEIRNPLWNETRFLEGIIERRYEVSWHCCEGNRSYQKITAQILVNDSVIQHLVVPDNLAFMQIGCVPALRASDCSGVPVIQGQPPTPNSPPAHVYPPTGPSALWH